MLQKISFTLGYFFCLLILIAASAGCKTATIIKTVNSEIPEIVQFKNGVKTVQFIPMHHIGKETFYENVRDLVAILKKDGYVVYYEFVEDEQIKDSAKLDLYKRKFRKMIGFQVDTGGYATIAKATGIFKQMINQPDYHYFNVDSADRRVDVTKDFLIDRYESQYGTIQLQPDDMRIPLEGSASVVHLRLPQANVMNVLLNSRNEYLASYIDSSSDRRSLYCMVRPMFREPSLN